MLFSGKFAIEMYAVNIFEDMLDNFDEYVATTMMGVVHLIGSMLFLPLLKYFNRKTILISSSLLMGIALLTLASCMNIGISKDGNYLPLLCILLYMTSAPLGLCSIPFMYIAELYPLQSRGILGGVTIGLSNAEMFVVVKTFPDLLEAFNYDGVFYVYAVSCLMAAFFVHIFIPETKDKELITYGRIFFILDLHVFI